ncbi:MULTISPECIES: ANTAR domain-containing protein [Mycolicibacterium]|uniref:ANTAR domain-containing protein n=1 Tax=Mycolicibacterium austroafricanum TaxID=39687 RepID=A0ABT8H9J1_MYCAO|nr:ANTAR domain-containing protein [Mycolicibacterium austroafricanum]MDN4517220.1 ANTAR domain-containing protein [Mycolicibacterium austroafricanum]
MGTRRTPRDDPRRAGARILDTAEGVIIALRRCTLNQAFTSLVQTAKSHNVAPLSLADALVAIAEGQPTDDLDAEAVRVAAQTWGPMLEGNRANGKRYAPTSSGQHDIAPSTPADHTGRSAPGRDE